MIKTGFDIFVSHIGIKQINIGGIGLSDYIELPGSEVVERKLGIASKDKIIRTLIMRFDDEKEMIDFLQQLVDSDVPFTDNYKSNAFMEASNLRDRGALKGEIHGIDRL